MRFSSQVLSVSEEVIMHLFFYVRGIKHQVDLWVTLAQGLFWKWKRTNLKTGKEEESLVQGALRPSILGAWEYIFPEECLAEAIAVLGVVSNSIDKNTVGATPTVKNKMKLSMIRKLFSAKKVPEYILEESLKIPTSITIKNSWRGVSNLHIPGIAIHIIGYKKDRRQTVPEKNGEWGYEQEML